MAFLEKNPVFFELYFMAHNEFCIHIIHNVQFLILEKKSWIMDITESIIRTDYEHYELPEPLMYQVQDSFIRT